MVIVVTDLIVSTAVVIQVVISRIIRTATATNTAIIVHVVVGRIIRSATAAKTTIIICVVTCAIVETPTARNAAIIATAQLRHINRCAPHAATKLAAAYARCRESATSASAVAATTSAAFANIGAD
jgi:hypothetical protein